jgi:hypothetical protein
VPSSGGAADTRRPCPPLDPGVTLATTPCPFCGRAGIIGEYSAGKVPGLEAAHDDAHGFTVQLNDADPDAPVVSVAVTTALEDAAVVVVPKIKPLERPIVRPAGSPLAL